MQNTRGLQLNQFTKLGLDPLGCSVNMEALAHYSETRGAKEHCTCSIKWFTPLSMSTRTLAYAVLQQRAPIKVLQYIGASSSVMAVCQGEPHSGFFVEVTITLFTWTGNQVEPGLTKPGFDLI